MLFEIHLFAHGLLEVTVVVEVGTHLLHAERVLRLLRVEIGVSGLVLISKCPVLVRNSWRRWHAIVFTLVIKSFV